MLSLFRSRSFKLINAAPIARFVASKSSSSASVFDAQGFFAKTNAEIARVKKLSLDKPKNESRINIVEGVVTSWPRVCRFLRDDLCRTDIDREVIDKAFLAGLEDIGVKTPSC
jgi:hypothetical protein